MESELSIKCTISDKDDLESIITAHRFFQGEKLSPEDNYYVNQWEMQEKLLCLILFEEGKMKTIGLIVDMESDSCEEIPRFALIYLYTIETERNKGYATLLLKHIRKNYHDIITVSLSETAEFLFEQLGYRREDITHEGRSVFRYP